MPRIFDNRENKLSEELGKTLGLSHRADFCVGYFRLTGWKLIDSQVDMLEGGEGKSCRILVGMQPARKSWRALRGGEEAGWGMDNQSANLLRKQAAQEFRQQLATASPTARDEASLRNLARQIREGKVQVKLHLKHPLHAKLYLLHRNDPINPVIGYLGSSNLTFSGLSDQGELNIDVLDGDACEKLRQWFESAWSERWSLDISEELAEIIEQSWAREEPVPPYHIYLKMAYHLSRDAREGLRDHRIPDDFKDHLLDFQKAAVQIAAGHLHKRGGVLIGDVVGLGKTLMATALARIFEDDFNLETLIICPKNLVPMWEGYRETYRMRAKVLSLSRVIKELPESRRYRLVLIDESHNLRNPDGQRYRAIQSYIRENESRCVLLTATPYNKSLLDLSSQLKLFLDGDMDIGMRPESLFRDMTEAQFSTKRQVKPRTLRAFELSEDLSDWRSLMRLFLVRRTRGFIKENYAESDTGTGEPFLRFPDGRKSFFPKRVPKTVGFCHSGQFSAMHSDQVVGDITSLSLPRYELRKHIRKGAESRMSTIERRICEDLSRGGRKLMGFCRIGLLKRLESSGHSFLVSIRRHLLRNHIYLHALESGKPVPIGSLDPAQFDAAFTDTELEPVSLESEDGDYLDEEAEEADSLGLSRDDFTRSAGELYEHFRERDGSGYRWMRAEHFEGSLARDLEGDSSILLSLLNRIGKWDPEQDGKLAALEKLVCEDHPGEKLLVFSQFAETAAYLSEQLSSRGVKNLEMATGASHDPAALGRRFSPVSNGESVDPGREIRVMVATDVLSEGQNLQDCSIVVNYDLPWAIIGLIQRAGRVDRIGQSASRILCYSFLPSDGIERLIRLQERVKNRLRENAELIGTDEQFFEGEKISAITDLYNEKEGILDEHENSDVDLSSYAYQIWSSATASDSSLRGKVEALPQVVFSSKANAPESGHPDGVLVYTSSGSGEDLLSWVGRDGESVTKNPFEILSAARCGPDTPAAPRMKEHHDLVSKAAEVQASFGAVIGGGLGSATGARYRVYNRLKELHASREGDFFQLENLGSAIDEIYRYPLLGRAKERISRQMRLGASDEDLAGLVISLWERQELCNTDELQPDDDIQIICSMGLVSQEESCQL